MAADPDLKVLRNFIAVATAGSISRAAGLRHIAQPALSQQIRNLEQNLGTRLLERTPRGVVTTEAGDRFLVHAIDILRRVDAALLDVREGRRSPQGSVAIGLPLSLARYLTTPLVCRVLSQYPGVFLQIYELGTGYIPEMLARGRIDIGFTFLPVDDPGIRSTRLVEEELGLLATTTLLRSHQIATGPARRGSAPVIAPADLARLPLILPPVNHSLRTIIDEHLKAASISTRVIAEVSTIAPLIDLALSGTAATILSLPSISEAARERGVHCLRLGTPALRRGVFLCQASTYASTLAVDAVKAAIVEVYDEVLASGKVAGLHRG